MRQEEHEKALPVPVHALHTTPMGAERIRKNLSQGAQDAVSWCREQLRRPAAVFAGNSFRPAEAEIGEQSLLWAAPFLYCKKWRDSDEAGKGACLRKLPQRTDAPEGARYVCHGGHGDLAVVIGSKMAFLRLKAVKCRILGIVGGIPAGDDRPFRDA